MNTNPNLTQRPPRSPRVRLGGYVILARIIDKGRAELAGTAGDYKYNNPMDRHWFRFTGVTPEALRTELAKGSMGWLNLSKDGQYVYVLDFTGAGAVLRTRVADHKTERVADLTNFVITGRFGGGLALGPDDSPLLLRDTGTQDVYALDWELP